VVPDALALDLPDDEPDELGACLGIPGITAHRAVFGDGSVSDATVLVHGVLGGVGTRAASLASRGGAAGLTTAAREGAVTVRIARPLPLAGAAEAHERVAAGVRERMLLAVDD
jgi:NADPH:quinone reductase